MVPMWPRVQELCCDHEYRSYVVNNWSHLWGYACEQQLGKVWEQGEYGDTGLPWLEIDSLNNDKYNLLWPY